MVAIPDYRNQSHIDHTYRAMLRQRVAQIACGYEDANDCNPLRTDPSLKLFLGKNPDSDNALSSQPTMSRFENAIPRSTLYRIAQLFVDCFVESYEEEPKVIALQSVVLHVKSIFLTLTETSTTTTQAFCK